MYFQFFLVMSCLFNSVPHELNEDVLSNDTKLKLQELHKLEPLKVDELIDDTPVVVDVVNDIQGKQSTSSVSDMDMNSGVVVKTTESDFNELADDSLDTIEEKDDSLKLQELEIETQKIIIEKLMEKFARDEMYKMILKKRREIALKMRIRSLQEKKEKMELVDNKKTSLNGDTSVEKVKDGTKLEEEDVPEAPEQPDDPNSSEISENSSSAASSYDLTDVKSAEEELEIKEEEIMTEIEEEDTKTDETEEEKSDHSDEKKLNIVNTTSVETSEEEKESSEGSGRDENMKLEIDSIQSFEEWKKNQMAGMDDTKVADDQKSPTLKIRTKKTQVNYASQDCGAKILSHNSEADHTFAVLDEDKDYYMLNPCTANIWFVIELCEPIQVRQIQLANYELFSSPAKHFNVHISERYPAREWRLLGSFEASNNRELQTFEPAQELMFAKYVKFEMKSHFGSEHFCPISIIRILGVSMVEEYEASEDTNDPKLTEDEDQEESKESEAIKDSESSESEGPISGLLTSVMGVVDNILGSRVKPPLNGADDVNATSIRSNLSSSNTSSNLSDAADQVVPIVTVISTGDIESGDFARLVVLPTSTPPLHPLRFLSRTYNSGGPHTLLDTHICWFLEYIYRASIVRCVVTPHCNRTSCGPYFFSDVITDESDDDVINAEASDALEITEACPKVAEEIEEVEKSSDPVKEENKEEETNPSTQIESQDADWTSSDPSKDPTKDVLQGAGPSLIDPVREGIIGGTVHPRDENRSPIDLGSSEKVLEDTEEEEEEDTKEQLKVADVIIANITEATDEVNSSVIAPIKEEIKATKELISNEQEVQPQKVINPGGNQKESVLMRLSNRIRTLEKNMSLSSAYLEDLSQRYKRQMDEMQRAFNRTTSRLSASARKAGENEEKQEVALDSVTQKTAKLQKDFEALPDQLNLYIQYLITGHICFVMFELSIFILFLIICWRSFQRSKMKMLKIEADLKEMRMMYLRSNPQKTIRRSNSEGTSPCSGSESRDFNDRHDAPSSMTSQKHRTTPPTNDDDVSRSEVTSSSLAKGDKSKHRVSHITTQRCQRRQKRKNASVTSSKPTDFTNGFLLNNNDPNFTCRNKVGPWVEGALLHVTNFSGVAR